MPCLLLPSFRRSAGMTSGRGRGYQVSFDTEFLQCLGGGNARVCIPAYALPVVTYQGCERDRPSTVGAALKRWMAGRAGADGQRVQVDVFAHIEQLPDGLDAPARCHIFLGRHM